MKLYAYYSSLCLVALLFCCKSPQRPIYENSAYSIYPDRVIEGEYEARVASPNKLVITYPMHLPHSDDGSVAFRFSINSRDNELSAGSEHRIFIPKDSIRYTSPILTFGEIYKNNNQNSGSIAPATPFTLRVDMRPIFQSFSKQGFYITPTGDKINYKDFKGLYVAGSSAPLTWDFENLYNKQIAQLTDTDGDSIFETTIYLDGTPSIENFQWIRTIGNIPDHYPTYHSQQPIVDILYNMALEELETNMRPDGTLRTGKEWDGVWTRDVSYSIILSLAYIAPEAAMRSLKAKVKNGVIIQDTGTGGAWPVSTDRVVWASAAWDIYLYTGNQEWFDYIFEIISNTAAADYLTARDVQTGLMRGEQSYLDWREQSYPRWMQPVDIYESISLSTNILHYNMFSILAGMSSIKGEDSTPFQLVADEIWQGINKYLWNPQKGYYGQYLYGAPYSLLSPNADCLGLSLSVLMGVATQSRAKQVIENAPTTIYGNTSIFPQITAIKPYHNNAIWPFVQSFWNLAAAKSGNEQAVLHGMGALYRAAALFGTNKELLVASTGHYEGTAVNSDNMLWSISGNIAMIYRLMFGINFAPDGIRFTPFVPHTMEGEKTIRNFAYRDANFEITLRGTGNKIKKFLIDGTHSDIAFVPTTLKGRHSIEIELNNAPFEDNKINLQPIIFATPTPQVQFKDTGIEIMNYDSLINYSLYCNGKYVNAFNSSFYPITPSPLFSQWNVVAKDNTGWESFMSSPIEGYPKQNLHIISLGKKEGVKFTTTENTHYSIPIPSIPTGEYYMAAHYANGSGPINTQNKCAIRTLRLNNEGGVPLVMPQRGSNEWNNWGFSNIIPLKITNPSGNKITIQYVYSQNANMNDTTNVAVIDYIQLIKR